MMDVDVQVFRGPLALAMEGGAVLVGFGVWGLIGLVVLWRLPRLLRAAREWLRRQNAERSREQS